jgi:hypothetical protein
MTIFHPIQPKHRRKLTSFSTSELCDIDEVNKSNPLVAKGVVESFWVLFSVKKYLPLPGMRAEKAVLIRH